jgi:hypothetical protein
MLAMAAAAGEEALLGDARFERGELCVDADEHGAELCVLAVHRLANGSA